MDDKTEKTESRKMTKQEAFELLSQVCALYKGTLAEHHTLQTALRVVDMSFNPEKVQE